MKLYNDLMNAVNTSEKKEFYFDDRVLDGIKYRIFNYRLVGFDTFTNNENAKWARGTMFDITDESCVKLICRPMLKFFNYAEGAVKHDSPEVEVLYIHEKLDGSLISTYLHQGELRLKSKGSLESAQAKAAEAFLNSPENAELKYILTRLAKSGCTANLEWTSPNNRIVVGYEKDELRLLNVIINDTGKLFFDIFNAINRPEFKAKTCYVKDLERIKSGEYSLTELVEKMHNEEDGEGYVITLFNKITSEVYQVKVKNHKYCNLHKLKDSINSDKTLCELVVRGQTDDIVEAFTHDEAALNKINEMELKVIPIYNKMLLKVEAFNLYNKHLDRKEFAIKAKEELGNLLPLAMNLYLGKSNDYKEYAIKHMSTLFSI